MMKSLFRWSATLSLVSSVLFASGLGGDLKAFALPEKDILEKLQPVPVFTIADDQGVPLVQVVENEKKVTGVFISRQDAQDFLLRVQKENPEIGQKVAVQPISLGQAYKLQISQKETDGLIVSYVPEEDEVESAKQILGQNGEEYKGGVPLFVAKAGKDQGYLTINQNNQQVIPMFFEKASVTAMVEQFKKQKPELASTVKIEVVPLENVIQTLQESDDKMLNSIILIPSQETVQFIRENLPKEPAKKQ